MSPISRFGPTMARSLIIQHRRHMASASAVSDPIQRLFVEKIRDIKKSHKALDVAHQKQLSDEMARLKRVYRVDDESKLAQMDYKFPNEVDVSLYDIDSSKELREQIHSGEYRKRLALKQPEESALLASIPDQTPQDLHLPPMNKPDPQLLIEMLGSLQPIKLAKSEPDHERPLDKVTVDDLEREMRVKFGDQMPTIHDDDSPQRDKVNFPREPRLLDCPPTRFHIIPESWFRFFYPKTGVTGPYAFAFGFMTFLMSKEWLVMEHELLTGISSICIFAYVVPKYGPMVREWFTKFSHDRIDGWENWQKGSIQSLGDLIDHYKSQLDQGSEVIGEIYKARRQEVDMQLEHEYRKRLSSIYEDTKRRLNYLVAVADSQRQIHHSNLVNAIFADVMNSIGPKLENEVLDDCITNLKRLASKNANAI